MIAEDSLINIIGAADPDDCDDVAIRKLLVVALRGIGADLTELLHDPAARPQLRIHGGIAQGVGFVLVQARSEAKPKGTTHPVGNW